MKTSYRLVLCFIGLLLCMCSGGVKAPQKEEKQVFLGLLVKDNDTLLPKFLECIDHLDYDKKSMLLQINVCSTSDGSRKQIKNWIAKNGPAYKQIAYIDNNEDLSPLNGTVKERSHLFGSIKNSYLQAAKEASCHFCAIVESDVFLAPFTLKSLIASDKPIISPMLRPVPEAGDPFRNFFAAVTEVGYYQDSPLYGDIAQRRKLGTFEVPCIQCAYLIDVKYADALNFQDEFEDWEFIAFSRNARKQAIAQYITNDREFGFFLHFNQDLPPADMQQFNLVASQATVTPQMLENLLKPYTQDDSAIQTRLETFPFDEYAIYRVNNADLFYVDEMYDFIKSCYIKQCAAWEENIHAELKKYAIPGSIAVDIGGHIGTHTLNLSRLVGENGRVHVFEPQAKLFVELVANMALNGCSNILFHHNALGNAERLVKMYLPRPDNEGMAHVVDSSSQDTGEQVRMIALDSLQLDRVSILKMDVEGHEMEVLDGARRTIAANKPVMIIEILPSPERQSKIERIEKLGYTASLLAGEDYLFLPKS